MAEGLEKERVILGLGNPGKKYEMTRHNMGFLALQALAKEQGWVFKEEKRFQAHVATGRIGTVLVHLLMPTTYMNESGRALRAFVDYYKLAPDQVIVVSDDIELDYGAIRLRPLGSAGGHNGLKSVEAHLKTRHYVRLRLGVGKGNPAQALADYVLDNFSAEELNQLPGFLERTLTALKLMLTADIATAMQSVNAKIKKEAPKIGAGEQKHE